MLVVAIFLGGTFLFLFIKSVQNGQFEDLKSPAYRMLIENSIISSHSNDQNDTKKGNDNVTANVKTAESKL